MLEDREHCELCEARVVPLITCVHCGLPVITRVPAERASDLAANGRAPRFVKGPSADVA